MDPLKKLVNWQVRILKWKLAPERLVAGAVFVGIFLIVSWLNNRPSRPPPAPRTIYRTTTPVVTGGQKAILNPGDSRVQQNFPVPRPETQEQEAPTLTEPVPVDREDQATPQNK